MSSFVNKGWDDVMAGPQPDHALDNLRGIRVLTSNLKTPSGDVLKLERSISMPTSEAGTPTTPTTPTTPSGMGRKDNVWRSVFHPGRNQNTRHIGADIFDKPSPTTSSSPPTVYDWLYSGETKSKHM